MSAALSLDAWKSQADKVTYRNLCFINNQFVPASSGKTFDNISPIHGKVLTKVASGDKEDIDRAVKAARHAFENGNWSRHRGERKRLLLRFADLIEKHNDELALLETHRRRGWRETLRPRRSRQESGGCDRRHRQDR